ncbi:23S rRNA (guanosine(2251)-2'-O)-methyltransferase RlmB [Mycoplasmopsis lipofaciens]|uniref:23S rRNA (guanosine(2251)-2'-O)-methyltransferase RlmB n=1 Tax=Mycoplasmopsis lipofaciens TaxID=114884 RepID=UPI000480D308|nr:23S rRNA (guanosine(2251)-2'-O)-methyltransferase RlmB [Mycoplasmopsis lipofaciens]
MKKLILCGRNTVMDAIQNNLPIDSIVVNSDSFAQKLKTKYKKINISIKDSTFFNEYKNDNHQGIIAILKDFPIFPLDQIYKDKPDNVLILDHIQDPHNLGAIIRTANAFGIKHIVLTKDKSCDITSTVLKVSSGGFVNMKIIKVSNLVATIKKMKEWNYWIYSSALNVNAKRFDSIEYNKPTCLIIGNEGNGVSLPVLKQSDEIIYIPQKGTVQSLNVSVASGLLIHQITKD